MYIYELNDIMFLVKSLKSPTDNFDIKNYNSFASNSKRSGAYKKLVHPMISNATQHHFYFNRIIRLHNYLPVINLSLLINIIKKQNIYGANSLSISILKDRAHFIFYARVIAVQISQFPVTLINFNQLLDFQLTFIHLGC